MGTIEQDLFATYRLDPEMLIAYGFQPDQGGLCFRKVLPEDDLEIILSYDGQMHGRIVDRDTGDDYSNFRIADAMGYSAQVRQIFTDLLLDIREKCGKNLYFKSEQARRIFSFIRDEMKGTPEFLWEKFPDYMVFRRTESQKWYALMAPVPRNKTDPASSDPTPVDLIDLKADPNKIGALLMQKGYYPAYHMNKKSWITVLLDETLPDEEIQARIRESYQSV